MIQVRGMELGFLWITTAIVSAGVCGALIRSWSWHTKHYSLERRVKLLEEFKQSDQQAAKSRKRWDTDKLLDDIKNHKEPMPVGAPQTKPWWEP